MENNQKIADKKKVYFQGLEKSRTDSAAESHDSYTERPRESHAQSLESYMKDLEVVLIVHHKAAKVTRKTWKRVVIIVLHGAMRVT